MDPLEEEIEEFQFYLNAKFDFHKSILFSSAVKKPNDPHLDELKSECKKIEIEKLYNHFHMSFITHDLEKQRYYANELWKKWRDFFNKAFPEKAIVIEICDYGQETIITVYQSSDIELGRPTP